MKNNEKYNFIYKGTGSRHRKNLEALLHRIQAENISAEEIKTGTDYTDQLVSSLYNDGLYCAMQSKTNRGKNIILSKDGISAEDLVQTAMMKFFHHLDTILDHPVERQIGYWTRICNTVAIDALRKMNKMPNSISTSNFMQYEDACEEIRYTRSFANDSHDLDYEERLAARNCYGDTPIEDKIILQFVYKKLIEQKHGYENFVAIASALEYPPRKIKDMLEDDAETARKIILAEYGLKSQIPMNRLEEAVPKNSLDQINDKSAKRISEVKNKAYKQVRIALQAS